MASIPIYDKDNWYCIKFDIPKDSNITALEFSRKMNSFLQEIDNFNHSIINGIDETYTVASYVEDFETGSIKWWLADKLSGIDDKAIDKFVDSPIKTTIAGILKFSKKKAIETLSDSNKEPQEMSKDIIDGVYKVIEEKKEDLEKDMFGNISIEIKQTELLNSVKQMSAISKELDENINFLDDYNNQEAEIKVNSSFASYESQEEEEETVTNITTRHLVVNKPELDYNSTKWFFIMDNKTIKVDISSTNIAKDAIQRGEVRVGDTYKVSLEEQEYKTPKGQFRIKYKALEVIEFNRGMQQQNLY